MKKVQENDKFQENKSALNVGFKIVKVISFDTAAGMTYMLRKVVEVGTGRVANISKATAGKTG